MRRQTTAAAGTEEGHFKHDPSPHLTNFMFLGVETGSEWQVDIHPSSFMVDQQVSGNLDEEDHQALERAYAQLEVVHSIIKRKSKHGSMEWRFQLTKVLQTLLVRLPQQQSQKHPLHSYQKVRMPKAPSWQLGPHRNLQGHHLEKHPQCHNCNSSTKVQWKTQLWPSAC